MASSQQGISIEKHEIWPLKHLNFLPPLNTSKQVKKKTNEWHSLPSLSRRLPKPDSKQLFYNEQPTVGSRVIDRGTTTPEAQLIELEDREEDDIFLEEPITNNSNQQRSSNIRIQTQQANSSNRSISTSCTVANIFNFNLSTNRQTPNTKNNNQQQCDDTIQQSQKLQHHQNHQHNQHSNQQLLSTTRRNSSWREVAAIFTILAIYYSTSMAIIGHFGRLQNPMGDQTSSLEDRTIATIRRRSPSSNNSRSTIPRRQYNREITYAERRLPVKFLHHTRKDKEATYSRLSKIKRICTMYAFQNGGYISVKGYPRRKGFNVQIRSKRCIRRGAHVSRLQTFPYLQAQQCRVPIQIIGFRTKRRSARIYKANAVRNRATKTARHPTSLVLRRHLFTR
ncbi:hypothetical protein BCV72DRAFT_48265, partial [Rhizopus microsporus var. microsporus]